MLSRDSYQKLSDWSFGHCFRASRNGAFVYDVRLSQNFERNWRAGWRLLSTSDDSRLYLIHAVETNRLL